MVAVGAFAVFQMVKLKTQYDLDLAAHEKKVEKIEDWSDAMFNTSERAAACLHNARDFDLDVLSLVRSDNKDWQTTVNKLAAHWDFKRFRRCVEILPFVGNPQCAVGLIKTMQEKQGVTIGQNSEAWDEELWATEKQNDYNDPSYGDFKTLLYRLMDPKFTDYFGADKQALIPLSQIRLSREVIIVPTSEVLKDSTLTSINDADDVFGMTINGHSRAYQKKQLASHKHFNDTLGEVEFTATYSPETDTLTAYENATNKGPIKLTPSAFTYQANRLFLDDQTKSLWLLGAGEPVVGTLCGKGLKLKPRASESSTWGAWKQAHPESTLLNFEE